MLRPLSRALDATEDEGVDRPLTESGGVLAASGVLGAEDRPADGRGQVNEKGERWGHGHNTLETR